MPEREELIAVARAVAAGLPVDWTTVESSASDESLRAAIRELKIVAEIADLHHTLPVPRPEAWSPEPEAQSLESDRSPEPEAKPRARSPEPTWGPFQLLERIGRGSFGEVYRARDSRLDREIALKLLHSNKDADDAGASSVIDEGRLLARVRHPNVVTVYGADRIDNRVGLWMEYVRGRTLEQLLVTNGLFSPRDVARIGVQICRALAAVHQAGLLHRDIKAQNVMRAEEGGNDGRLVLMDFGAGRERLDHDETSSGLAGTPLYLAPELFERQSATARSDIYSLGVLLHHLLTGTYPVTGRTVREVRARHREGQPSSIRQIRPDATASLVEAIDRALAVDPADRFATAEQMAGALEKLEAPVALRSRSSAAVMLAGGGILTVASILVLNVGGAQDLMRSRLGRPTPPPAAGQPRAMDDRSFAVRKVLAPGEAFDYGRRPSLDGRYLPILDHDRADVAVKDLQTGQIRVLTRGSNAEGSAEGAPAISSDDRWLAYPWSTPDRAFEVRIIDMNDPSPLPQPRVLLRRTDAEPYPIEWSQDGTEILMLLEKHDGAMQLALVSSSDGALRPVKDLGTTRPLGLSLSPDRRFVAYDYFPQNARTRDIYVVSTESGEQWQLIDHPAGDMFPFWMPDGRQVLFTSDRTGALGLWTVSVADGRPAGEPTVLSRDMGRITPIGPTQDGAFFRFFRLIRCHRLEYPCSFGPIATRYQRMSKGWRRYAINVGTSVWIPGRNRLANLYRSMGRTKEADQIDAELLKLLAVADADHPVLMRLKARR